MSFPDRVSRSAFGPTPTNRGAIVDPERQLSAEIGDLLFWQVAGVGLTADVAWCVVDDAGAFVVGAEAWDPRQDQADPATVRTGPGVYQVQYDPTVPDKDGTMRTLALRAAVASPQTTSAFFAVAEVGGDGRTVAIKVFDAAGAPADCKFLLTVK